MNEEYFDVGEKEKYSSIVYDGDFLRELNKEWEAHPFKKSFVEYSHEAQLANGQKRTEELAKHIDLKGKKILEIGGGSGYTSYAIARMFPDAVVVCNDTYENSRWKELQLDNLRFVLADLTKKNPFSQEEFDVVISFVAWEHIRNPFEALQQTARILKTDGVFYLYANLYRGPEAHHLYRVINFPYAHLLFDEAILKAYALELGVEEWYIRSFCDVNKLTYAEYKEYFRKLKFEILEEKRQEIRLDYDFYTQFYDKLSLYPIYDLETNTFTVLLKKTENVELEKRIWMASPVISDQKAVYKVGDEVEICARVYTEECKIAWYVLVDGAITDKFMYPRDKKLIYRLKKVGKTSFRSYAKNDNCIVYMDTPICNVKEI